VGVIAARHIGYERFMAEAREGQAAYDLGIN
jgi:hypothetical protein